MAAQAVTASRECRSWARCPLPLLQPCSGPQSALDSYSKPQDCKKQRKPGIDDQKNTNRHFSFLRLHLHLVPFSKSKISSALKRQRKRPDPGFLVPGLRRFVLTQKSCGGNLGCSVHVANMAVRRILTIGNSKLRQYAKPLTKEEINAPVTRQIVRDMAATLKEKKGWGISAPQIGVQKQIIIFDIPHLDSAFDGWPFSVIYNPKIEILLSEETNLIWEECHSVPGLVGLVPRHHTCALFWTVRFSPLPVAQILPYNETLLSQVCWNTS